MIGFNQLALTLSPPGAGGAIAAFTLPDNFSYALTGDSIDTGPLRDALTEQMGHRCNLIAGGNYAISGTEVVHLSQINPFVPDQQANIEALTNKPTAHMMGGAENSLTHGDTAANILGGYDTAIASDKAAGIKTIIRNLSESWMTGQNSTKLAAAAAVKAGLLARMAADPAQVLVIDTDAYDHTFAGYGYNVASGSFPDGSQHPNTCQGAPRLGAIMAAAITPYIGTPDTSIYPASGNLVQNQNLNPIWNWPSFGAVSGTGYSGSAPAGVTIANSSDAAITLASGTVTSGDVAIVITDANTATAVGTFTLTIPITCALKANRAYVVDIEVEFSDNAGTGDAVGLYNLSASVTANAVTIGQAYTGGSTWPAADMLNRKVWFRTYMPAALVADASSLSLVLTGATDARAHDLKVKIGRTFVRAPVADPLNYVVNLSPITGVLQNAPATLTVTRGHSVGTKSVPYTITDSLGGVVTTGTISLAAGSTSGSTTFTTSTADTYTVTLNTIGGLYTIGSGVQTVVVNAAGSYDSDAVALFARFATPATTQRKDAINACILALKTGAISGSNIWAKLDVLVFDVGDGLAGYYDWKNAFNPTKNGSGITYTTDRGWTGTTATTDYFDMAYYFGIAGSTATQNSAHLGMFARSTALATQFPIGNTNSYVQPRTTGDLFGAELNATVGGTAANASGDGHYMINRSVSTTQVLYKNGSVAVSHTRTSAAPTATNMRFLARLSGSAGWPGQALGYHAGVALTANEITDLYNALYAYAHTELGAI